MNLLSNLVPKLGLSSSHASEAEDHSHREEPSKDLSIQEAQNNGQSVGYSGLKPPPSHISLPSNDNFGASEVPTPYSDYQTPSTQPHISDGTPDTNGDGDPLKKEPPESQPSIDPLSLHIIRRVSYRVQPKDLTQVAEVQATQHSDKDVIEGDHPKETSGDKISHPQVKSLKHSVMNRFGSKKDKAKPGVQSVTEGNASEHSDASSISSVERCPSFESQRAVGRNALSTIPTRGTGVAPHGQPNVKTRSKIKPNRAFARMIFAQTLASSHYDGDDAGYANGNNPVASAVDDESLVQDEPIGAVWVLKFSKDGKYLASGGQDCVLRVWQVIGDDSNILQQTEDETAKGVPSDESIKVFEDKPIHEYEGHQADILDIGWSKNNFLLSSSMDKTVRLWHIIRKECLCVFQHLDVVTSITFHPRDDRFFLSGSLDCKLRLWNIPDKKVAYWNEVPDSNMVTAVGFTQDGKIAVAGSYIGSCFFYETEGLRYNTQITLDSNKNRNSKKARKITGIESMPGMPPGEEKLLITSNDSRIRLINLKDKGLVAKYKGLDNPSMQIRATFSDDGRQIICGSEDRNIFIWETEQAGFSPFHYLQDSRYKTAATLGHFGEQLVQTAVNSTHHNGQPTRVSGWLKRGGEKVKEKLKGGYEYFEGHNQVVTAAIFAPTRTRQLIARTGRDTIYNNTTIPEDHTNSHSSDPHLNRSISNTSNLTTQTELEAEKVERARKNTLNYTYPNGQIIVSSDNIGVIKVWRVDCGIYTNTLLSPTTTKQDHIDGSSVPLQQITTSGTESTVKSTTRSKRNLASIFGKHK
ncbi:WD40-repeat-containing domain protein [Umbelopsis sp. PMI_123]|nr:WD40-repeat-containing domain protein [Umbelopsis sp. PMI_123]